MVLEKLESEFQEKNLSSFNPAINDEIYKWWNPEIALCEFWCCIVLIYSVKLFEKSNFISNFVFVVMADLMIVIVKFRW